jgi:hypothetical protein
VFSSPAWSISSAQRSASVASYAACRGGLQSTTADRQMIALMINFRKPNKNSLERRIGAYRSNRKNKTPYTTYNRSWSEYKTGFFIPSIIKVHSMLA